jgi:hypothetical protein
MESANAINNHATDKHRKPVDLMIHGDIMREEWTCVLAGGVQTLPAVPFGGCAPQQFPAAAAAGSLEWRAKPDL